MGKRLNNKILYILLSGIIITLLLPCVCLAESTDLTEAAWESAIVFIENSIIENNIEFTSENYENNIEVFVDNLYPRIKERFVDNKAIDFNAYSQDPSDAIIEARNLMNDLVIVISELKKVGYKVSELPEKIKTKLEKITSDTIREYTDNETIKERFLEYSGDYGEEIISFLEKLQEGKIYLTDDGNFSYDSNNGEINYGNPEYFKPYLDIICVVYRNLHNTIAEKYYNNDENQNKDEYGLIVVQDDDIKPDDDINQTTVDSIDDDDESDTQSGGGLILGFLDFIFGLLLYPIKLSLMVPGLIGQAILSSLVSAAEGGITIGVSIDQILFNQLAITDINIFSNVTAAGKDLMGNAVIMEIRTLIANWYYAFRNFVIVIYLCILIYIGIRMAISSIADDKAKYKNMFKNWVVGLALVMVLHVIIIVIISINNQLLMIIRPTETEGYTDLMGTLFSQCFWIDFTTSFGSAILYSILTVLTFVFLIIYVKRMITISFLICIAPLITLTYPIDKATDNKSQILNSWLKEFITDVLIQFFHCIIYVVLVQSSVNNMLGTGPLDFGAMFVSIVTICCIFYVEGIVKKLFGLDQGGTSFLKTLAMGKIFGEIGKNVKVIRGSKNDNQQQTQEVPDYMPNGEKVSDVAKREKISGVENPNSENSNSENQKNVQKSPEKKENLAKKLGKGYLGLMGAVAGVTVPGFNKINNKRKNKFNISLKETQKLFTIACSDYIEAVDPNMTKEEFVRQMKVLNETKMQDIKTGQGVAMKQMMISLQRAYDTKPTSITNIKEKLIDEKMYSPEERLNKSIESFAKEYQFKG